MAVLSSMLISSDVITVIYRFIHKWCK